MTPRAACALTRFKRRQRPTVAEMCGGREFASHTTWKPTGSFFFARADCVTEATVTAVPVTARSFDRPVAAAKCAATDGHEAQAEGLVRRELFSSFRCEHCSLTSGERPDGRVSLVSSGHGESEKSSLAELRAQHAHLTQASIAQVAAYLTGPMKPGKGPVASLLMPFSSAIDLSRRMPGHS